MSTAFVTTRRVEFSDTDAAGIMHFAAFFRMMEQAEHDLLRSVGLSVVMHDDEGKISWPRVAAKCDFQAAARFEDLLRIPRQIHQRDQRQKIHHASASKAGPRQRIEGESPRRTHHGSRESRDQCVQPR